jgi:hypothetical protein
VVFAVTSCTAPVVFQESYPEEEFYESTELVPGADSVFQCWMSYEYDDGDCRVFYIHLVNYSVLSAMFDPAACFLEYKGKRPNIPGEPNLRVYALNPEAEIQYLAQEKAKEEERNSTDLGLNILSAVFDIAVNVFDGESGDEAEIVEDALYHGGNIASNIAQAKEQEKFYKEAESFWKNEVLRKTIVQSGEEVSGLIYFPMQYRSKEFSAVVPFAGTNNLFEIELIK